MQQLEDWGTIIFPVMYVRTAPEVFPNWSQKKKNRYLWLFPVVSRLWYQTSWLLGFHFLGFQITCVCCAWKWRMLGKWLILFRAHVGQACKLVISTIISMRKQKRFVSKQGQSRPRTQLKARVLTKQLKNGLLEATLLGPLLPPRNSSSCYFDTIKYVFPSPIWAILL